MLCCQPLLKMAARFGYCLILSPARYGVRSASLLWVAWPNPGGSAQVGTSIQSGSWLPANSVGRVVVIVAPLVGCHCMFAPSAAFSAW